MSTWMAEDIAVLTACETYEQTDAEFQRRFTKSAFVNKKSYLKRKQLLAEARYQTPKITNPEPPPPEDDDDYEKRWGLLEDADAILTRIEPTTETAEWTSPDHLPVGIVFIGDTHFGAGGVRYDLFKRDMDILAETEGLFAIGMGDYLENTKPQGKSGNALYGALFPNAMEEMLYTEARMLIAKDKWKVLCGGNHDGFDGRWAGLDRLPELAEKLGAAYFTQGGGTFFCNVGSQKYVINVRHNHAGNSRINSTNAQRRMFDDFKQWESADACCIAHLHFNDCHKTQRRGDRTVYLRSGTYKTRDSYAQNGAFTPEYGCPLIILLPDEKRVIPFSGEDWLFGVEYLKVLRERYRRERAA